METPKPQSPSPETKSPATFPPNLRLDDLRALKVLGQGALGTVFLVHDPKSDPAALSPFALKVAEKSGGRRDSERRARWEISVLRRLSHPFLPRLVAEIDGVDGDDDLLAWGLPFCPGGDLNRLRHRQSDRVFSPAAIRFYLAEIVLALRHLHSLGLAYRDLKPENVLVQSSGHLTLTDFDLSRQLIILDHEHDRDLDFPPPGARRQQIIHRRAPGRRRLANLFRKGNENGACSNCISVISAKHGNSTILPGNEKCVCNNNNSNNRNCISAAHGNSTILHHSYNNSNNRNCISAKHGNRNRNGEKCVCSGTTTDSVSAKHGNGAFSSSKSARVSPVSRPRLERSGSFVGTEEYVAPEVVRGGGHGLGVDWWALGVLAYEMLYGTTPFKGRTRRETFRNILASPPRLVGKRTAVIDLIERLLAKDPAGRLGGVGGAEEVMGHWFFEGVRWDMVAGVSRPPYIPEGECAAAAAGAGLGTGMMIREHFRRKRAPPPPSPEWRRSVSLSEL